MQGRQRNVQKSVMLEQNCCFAHYTYCLFDVPVAVADVVSKANLDGDQEDGVPGRGDMELERRLCSRQYKLKQAEVATVRLRLPTKKENEIK